MSTTLLKRKNIDLPIETLRKLSILAATEEKSLKGYIEYLLITKADSVTVTIKENPSPSGDPWFEDIQNVEAVKHGIEQIENGQGRELSLDDVKQQLFL